MIGPASLLHSQHWVLCFPTLHDVSGSCEHTSYGTSLHSSLLVIVQSCSASTGGSSSICEMFHLSGNKIAVDFGNSPTLPSWHGLTLLHLNGGAPFSWHFLTHLPWNVRAILSGKGLLGQMGITLGPACTTPLAPNCTAAYPLAHIPPFDGFTTRKGSENGHLGTIWHAS